MYYSDKEKLEYFYNNFPEIFQYFEQLEKENKDFSNIKKFIEGRMLRNIKGVNYDSNFPYDNIAGAYYQKEIILNPKYQDKNIKDIVTHEAIHAISDKDNGIVGFHQEDGDAGIALNEGFTEYLKNKILYGNNVPLKEIMREGYDVEIGAIKFFKNFASEENFLKDYLTGSHMVEQEIER